MIDPKRFDDPNFVVEYFGDSVGDINAMSRRLIDDNVQGVNLLNVVSTLVKRIKELTEDDTSAEDTKAEVAALDKQREEKQQVQQSINDQKIETGKAQTEENNQSSESDTETQNTSTNSGETKPVDSLDL
jgi:cell division septation protein DedD